MKAALVAGLLCATASFAAAQGPAEVKRTLDFGLWNARINALYDLSETDREPVPLLLYAAQDADWQVRLTAVHFLGRASAAPALAAIAREESCPHVRMSALKWLTRLGDEGIAYYRDAVTPLEQLELERDPYLYGNEHMGKPLVIDAPGGQLTRDFFEGGLDSRLCASSEHSRHPHPEWDEPPMKKEKTAMETQELAEAPEPPKRFVPRVEPRLPETPAQKRLNAELDALLALEPEDLPRPSVPNPRDPNPIEGESGVETPARPSSVVDKLPTHSGVKETFAPIRPLPERLAEDEAADYAEDGGLGRIAFDPIPTLIARLSADEPRERALAAEILGKRGAQARDAAPALRRALKDSDRRVRANAALALGDIGVSGRGVRSDLKRAAKDGSEDVRDSALLALQRIDDRR